MSMNHFKGDQTIFTCSLPGSVKHDTTCHLYFGEANHPAETKNIMKTRSSKTNQWFCQFFIPEGDLLRRLQSVQQKDASCDYSLEDDGKVLSPRSDPYDLTGLVKSESVEIKTTQMFTTSELQTILTSASTKGQAVPEPPTSAGVTTVQVTSANHNPTTNTTSAGKATENVGSGVDSSGRLIWKWLVGLTAAGITVGVTVFVLVYLRVKRRADINMKITANTEMTPAGKERFYSVIQPEADCPTASDKSDNQQEQQDDDSDVYHVYNTISDILPAATKMDAMYSFLQEP
ncbi:uncharacterized protein LOC108229327 [Kryptolebias marmoratus]|uniref:uncharacterized protein LOC108229327 n=1 Tax=Kryptolebias marmoratus TaxID=37003 RepID=UPI000D52FDB3|nr:uncharacterized protein LOC108229327 [Kryptolebias marmoratus]